MGGNLEFVRILLEAGAMDPDDEALSIATNRNNPDIVALIRLSSHK
jgi:hypothetical protein